MSDEPEMHETSREELLDNTPEAVAMRRARAQRAEAKAKADAARAQAEQESTQPGSLRRKIIIGGVLGLATAARVLAKVNRTSRPR
jgi:hypothetical protein